MANTFKNKTLDGLTSYADLIPAVASSTTVVVLSMRATNVDGSSSADIDVQFVDSDGSTDSMLASTIPVPADSSLELVAGKLVLETGDKIQAKASATGDIEFFVSYLEIT
jgi:hypothetical protein